MTPTKADIAFFTSEEAKRIQEEWEPKFGDWALTKEGNEIVIVSRYGQYEKTANAVLIIEGGIHSVMSLDRVIFLPRQDQLIEMLEERGYFWILSTHKADDESWCGFGNQDKQDFGSKRGPTPSIALGRALIEVMKDV